jgi:hypothetical protein
MYLLRCKGKNPVLPGIEAGHPARSLITILGEVSGSYGDEYEDDCLLERCAVYSGRSLPAFHRCLLSPSSGRYLHSHYTD